MSERTAVYRLFATDDTLLYVGVAKRFGTRWEQHAKVQPWWPHVDHQTVQWYPAREDALLAEKVAIETERPVYNIAGSPWRGGIKDDGTGFYVAPKPPPKPRVYVTKDTHTPNRVFRAEEGLWRDYGEACEVEGVTRSDDLRAHMQRRVRAWKREQAKAAPPDA